MEVTYYDHSFNLNEWFIIISTILLSIIVWKLPNLFSKLESIAYYLYGIFIGMFFDHTISVPPLNYYDVNDNSSYQVIDFVSYIMYGPFSYFFLYFYVKFKIKGYKNLVYILIWTAISILIEWIGIKVGIFHYRLGYKIFYSIPIYLFMQTLQVIIYKIIQNNSKNV